MNLMGFVLDNDVDSMEHEALWLLFIFAGRMEQGMIYF